MLEEYMQENSERKIHELYNIINHSSGAFRNISINRILSIKNGKDSVPIEHNCFGGGAQQRLQLFSEIGTLSLTLVILMTFFARLSIYYKTFTSRISIAICVIVHIMLPYRFLYSNLQTVTAIAVFCENINGSRVEKEVVK
jgi:hypothetical protein